MGTEPLKKELESIDLELESAMQRLTETTQRVDDVLADFTAGDGMVRKSPPVLSLHTDESDSPEEPSVEDAEEVVEDEEG